MSQTKSHASGIAVTVIYNIPRTFRDVTQRVVILNNSYLHYHELYRSVS